MRQLKEIHDHEVDEWRHTKSYAAIFIVAILATIAAIVLTYGGFAS
jgi:hypothetical protein